MKKKFFLGVSALALLLCTVWSLGIAKAQELSSGAYGYNQETHKYTYDSLDIELVDGDSVSISTNEELYNFADYANNGGLTSGITFNIVDNINLNDEQFTFIEDTGLIKVTDGLSTAYLGTGICGKSGNNETFDSEESIAGRWYNSSMEILATQPSIDAEKNLTVEGLTISCWEPINNFNGTMISDDFTINGLFVQNPNNDSGFFGSFSENTSAVLQGISLENTLVIGQQYVGSLVGRSISGNALIHDCQSNGFVLTYDGNYVGGLAGYYNGDLTKCSFNGIAKGSIYFAGGLIGYADEANLINCFNNGDVYGYRDVGGLIGFSNKSNSNNCYNTGDITATENAGSIYGNSSNSTMSNFYNSGIVVDSDEIGDAYWGHSTSSFMTNCYTLDDTKSSNFTFDSNFKVYLQSDYVLENINNYTIKNGDSLSSALNGYLHSTDSNEYLFWKSYADLNDKLPILVNPIKYDENGGAPVPNDGYMNGETVIFPTTTKDGFIFDGWYQDELLSGEVITSTASFIDEYLYLYAKWSAIVLELDFDGQTSSYASFEDLMDAVSLIEDETTPSNKATITLCQNCEVVENIVFEGGDFILNLNGYTLNSKPFTFINDAQIVFNDTTNTDGEIILDVESSEDLFTLNDSVYVSFEGGIYESTNGIINCKDQSYFNIKGGDYISGADLITITSNKTSSIAGTSSFSTNGGTCIDSNSIGNFYISIGDDEEVNFYNGATTITKDFIKNITLSFTGLIHVDLHNATTSDENIFEGCKYERGKIIVYMQDGTPNQSYLNNSSFNIEEGKMLNVLYGDNESSTNEINYENSVAYMSNQSELLTKYLSITLVDAIYPIYYYDQGESDDLAYSGYNDLISSYAYTTGCTLLDGERTGYHFEGWYTSYNGDEKVTNIMAEQKGIVKLYARWAQYGLYDVKFGPNQVFDFNSAERLKVGAPYNFSCGSGTSSTSYQFTEEFLKDKYYMLKYSGDDDYPFALFLYNNDGTGVVYNEINSENYCKSEIGTGGAAFITDTAKNYILENYGYAGLVNIGTLSATDLPGLLAGENNNQGCLVFVSINGYGNVITYESAYTYSDRFNVDIFPADVDADIANAMQIDPEIYYCITYIADSNLSTNPHYYSVNTPSFTLDNPTRGGHTFTGWSGTDLIGNNNLNVTITNGSTGNRNYEENWTVNFYTITYDAGSSTSGNVPDPETIEFYSLYTVDNTYPLTRDNYVQVGWSLSGENFNGNEINTLLMVIEDNVLYPVWKKATKITVNDNTEDIIVAYYGEAPEAIENTSTLTAHLFNGFSAIDPITGESVILTDKSGSFEANIPHFTDEDGNWICESSELNITSIWYQDGIYKYYFSGSQIFDIDEGGTLKAPCDSSAGGSFGSEVQWGRQLSFDFLNDKIFSLQYSSDSSYPFELVIHNSDLTPYSITGAPFADTNIVNGVISKGTITYSGVNNDVEYLVYRSENGFRYLILVGKASLQGQDILLSYDDFSTNINADFANEIDLIDEEIYLTIAYYDNDELITYLSITNDYTFTNIDVPTKIGYVYKGYSKDGTTESDLYYNVNGEPIENAYLDFDNENKSTALKVIWDLESYEITYYAGEGVGDAPEADTKDYGVSYTLSSSSLTRIGYIQSGWSTTENGNKEYDLEATYTGNADLSLYPTWLAKTYHYDCSDSGVIGYTEDVSITYAVYEPLSSSYVDDFIFYIDNDRLQANGSYKECYINFSPFCMVENELIFSNGYYHILGSLVGGTDESRGLICAEGNGFLSIEGSSFVANAQTNVIYTENGIYICRGYFYSPYTIVKTVDDAPIFLFSDLNISFQGNDDYPMFDIGASKIYDTGYCGTTITIKGDHSDQAIIIDRNSASIIDSGKYLLHNSENRYELYNDGENILADYIDYSITYYNQGDEDHLLFDGDEISSEYLTYNSGTAFSLPEPTKTGYTFEGWYSSYDGDTSLTEIEADEYGSKVYYAKWSIRTDVEYIVYHYFEELDGSYTIDASKTENLTGTYNETAEALYLSPLPEGFTSDMENENSVIFGIISVNETLELQLYYKRLDYTITWKNGDTTVETDNNVLYGAMPEYNGDDLTKAADAQYTYTFDGWTPTLSEVTGDITYTATYSSTVNEYTITWLDDDETILTTTQVPYGTIPTYEDEDPTKVADAQYTYTFDGWTPSFVEVTGEATYTATYSSTVNEYTITWLDDDETVLTTTQVPYGTIPTYENEDPTKVADAQYTYTFDGWTPSLIEVTGETTYTATYSRVVNTYTVTWENDDTTIETDENVEYGVMPSYDGVTPTKTATAQYTYTFEGWTPAVSTVTGDVTYTATFSRVVNTYTVTWKNGNTTIETDEDVEYGVMPSYNGATPTHAATAQYTFTFYSWTPAVSTVTGDVTYTAIYSSTVNEYTITWLNEDETALTTTQVPYGTIPTYEDEDPTKAADVQYTYTFDGWTPALIEVRGEATYKATFTRVLREYSVTWMNGEETIESDLTAQYGSSPAYDGETPTKTADAKYTYAFGGWSDGTRKYTNISELPMVVGDTSYYAFYNKTVNNYTITWISDGVTLETDTTAYDEMPTYNGAIPTKDGFIFKKWSPSIVSVSGNATYTAIFNDCIIETETNEENPNLANGEILIPNGVDAEAQFIINIIDNEDLNKNIKPANGQRIVTSYNASLVKDNEVISDYSGNMTIKVLMPEDLKNAKNIKVVIYDKTTDKYVTKTVGIEDNYLIFTTNSLGDFAFTADKEINILLWIIIGVCSLLFIIAIILFFLLKRNVKYTVDNKIIAVGRYRRNQEIIIPTSLGGYIWHTDKEMKVPFIEGKMKNLGISLYGLGIPLAIVDNNDGYIDTELSFEGIPVNKIKISSQAKNYIDKLNALSSMQKKYYCEIKNELLSYPDFANAITHDGDTFKIKNHVYVKISVLKGQIKFFIDLEKENIDGRYRRYDSSKFKKYKSMPQEFTIDRPVEIRKAINNIARLADFLQIKKGKVICYSYKILTNQ